MVNPVRETARASHWASAAASAVVDTPHDSEMKRRIFQHVGNESAHNKGHAGISCHSHIYVCIFINLARARVCVCKLLITARIIIVTVISRRYSFHRYEGYIKSIKAKLSLCLNN
jgi:hypothetical protein